MMSKRKILRSFACDQSGAVALDWVALTSTVVVIGIGLAYMVYGGEDGSIATLVENYNAELGQAADNLTGVVAAATPPVLE